MGIIIILLCLLPVRCTADQRTQVDLVKSKVLLKSGPNHEQPVIINTNEINRQNQTIAKKQKINNNTALVEPLVRNAPLPPPPTLRNDQSKQLFKSQVVNKMAQPSGKVYANKNTTPPSAENNSDRIVFIDDELEETVNVGTRSNPQGATSPVSNAKPIIPEKAPNLNLSMSELDDRVAFDGDKCPTGYIRVNGQCVKVD